MTYSLNFRRKVLSAHEKEGLTISEVASRFIEHYICYIYNSLNLYLLTFTIPFRVLTFKPKHNTVNFNIPPLGNKKHG